MFIGVIKENKSKEKSVWLLVDKSLFMYSLILFLFFCLTVLNYIVLYLLYMSFAGFATQLPNVYQIHIHVNLLSSTYTLPFNTFSPN